VHDGWKPYHHSTSCRHARCTLHHHLRERTVLEIVCSQLTQADMFAGWSGGDHLPDLHLVVSDDYPLNEYLDELTLLVEGGIGQAGLDALAEAVDGGDPAGEFVVVRGWLGAPAALPAAARPPGALRVPGDGAGPPPGG
jgi:hypothetical protein